MSCAARECKDCQNYEPAPVNSSRPGECKSPDILEQTQSFLQELRARYACAIRITVCASTFASVQADYCPGFQPKENADA